MVMGQPCTDTAGRITVESVLRVVQRMFNENAQKEGIDSGMTKGVTFVLGHGE